MEGFNNGFDKGGNFSSRATSFETSKGNVSSFNRQGTKPASLKDQINPNSPRATNSGVQNDFNKSKFGQNEQAKNFGKSSQSQFGFSQRLGGNQFDRGASNQFASGSNVSAGNYGANGAQFSNSGARTVIKTSRPQGQGLNINKVYPRDRATSSIPQSRPSATQGGVGVRGQAPLNQNRRPQPNSVSIPSAQSQADQAKGIKQSNQGANGAASNLGDTKSPKDNTQYRNKSAEERLNRSMQNLAYTSGRVGANIGFNQGQKYDFNQSQQQSSVRKKVGGVVLDMDTIQDVSQQGVETRGKRNNAVILILSLLLIASCAYLAITVLQYVRSKRAPTCFYHINSDVEAKWFVEGAEKTELIVPDDLQANTKYLMEAYLIIDSTEEVELIITVSITCKGQEIDFAGLTGTDDKLGRAVHNDKVYEYAGTIVGGGKIYLFGGIDFAGAPNYINSNNVKIDITADISLVN